MANNFTTIQQNQTSQKFLLTRLEPARYINGDLVLDSGTTYTATFSFPISKIEQNGAALTKVSGTPSTGEFSHNETTGLLTVNITTAPSSSSAIIAYYYLFYTGERFRVLSEDPEDSNTTVRDWEPKIVSSPKLKFPIKNILNGVLSISSSDIGIVNDNDEFNQYLTDNDSFYQKNITIWQCLDSTDNIQKIFQGKITNISATRKKVTISFQDDIVKLNSPALMGDNPSECYFTKDDFPNVDPQKEGEPVRYIVGTVSRHQLLSESVTNLNDARRLNPEKMNEAVCTNFSSTISTTTNREFGICRVSSNGFTSWGFTPSAVDNTDANFTVLDGTAAEIAKIFIGDTFQDSNTNYSRVYHVDRGTNKIYITKNAAITTSDTVNSNAVPSIVIFDFDRNVYYPLYGRDYTAATSSTSNGNTYVKITFTNNFEASFGGLTSLDPTTMQVFYRVKPDSANQKHGTVLSDMLTAAGVTVNSTSITNANSALAVNANFSIPFFDELDFNDYYKYAEELLQSTLGYIFLNNSFEIEYGLLATPTSTTEITNTDIKENTYSVDIDYQDIVTQIIGFNPHHNSSEVVDNTSQTSESIKSRYLHDINRTTRFRHVLEDFSGKITDHINVRSERFALYRFVTKQLNYASELGDDFQLTKLGIPGQAANRDIKIMGITKEVDKTTIEASDLLNI
jgi:hypothetical protein